MGSEFGDLVTDGLLNTYTYNVNGMLIASNGIQYLYDALNQRVDKVGGPIPGDTIYFGVPPVRLAHGYGVVGSNEMACIKVSVLQCDSR